MIVSGHQSAYLPWLGLLHKATLCDLFVYMDDVQFLERDFNNRNRIVTPSGQFLWLTVPVDKKKSTGSAINNIYIKEDANKFGWQEKHWATIKTCYGRSPYFKEYSPFFEWVYLESRWERLSELNLEILKKLFDWFEIKAQIEVASDHQFTEKKSNLILEHCKKFNADMVVTGVFGRDYIDLEKFQQENIQVEFQNYNHPIYKQRCQNFVSNLSAIDLLFNHGESSREIMISGNIKKEDL